MIRAEIAQGSPKPGLPENVKAYDWYRKASTGGDAESQLQVGILYWVNYKIKADAEDGRQAELWLQKAAEQGRTFAQRHLAEHRRKTHPADAGSGGL